MKHSTPRALLRAFGVHHTAVWSDVGGSLLVLWRGRSSGSSCVGRSENEA